ncbi:MAG TPA: porin [Acidobacteriota bacterium]|nr:porin [Acidobacteriota bacterium]
MNGLPPPPQDRSSQGNPSAPPVDPIRFHQRLILEVPNEKARLQVGGRLHYDFSLLSSGPSDAGVPRGPTELRRLFATLSGNYGRFLAKAEWDFADGEADVVDLYAGFERIPLLGRLRFGKIKEPFGVERVTSDNNTLFVDRFLGASAFFPTRNLGAKLDNVAWAERLFWSLGIFRDASGFDVGRGPLNYSGRLSIVAWEKGERRMLQAGLSLSRRNPPFSEVRIQRRPNSRFGIQTLDSGLFPASSARFVSPQVSLLWDRLSVHGTWVRAAYQRLEPQAASPSGAKDRVFESGVIQLSYALSSGFRPFDRRNAVFRRMRGFKALHKGGVGGWEIGARLAVLDLQDDDIRGGRVSNVTLGINWYPTRFSRVMINYLRSDFDVAEREHRLLGRLQLSF